MSVPCQRAKPPSLDNGKASVPCESSLTQASMISTSLFPYLPPTPCVVHLISHPSPAGAAALPATGPVLSHQFCTKDVSRFPSWSSAPDSTPLNLTYIPQPPHFQSTPGAHGSCRMDRASTGGFGTGHSPATPLGLFQQ